MQFTWAQRRVESFLYGRKRYFRQLAPLPQGLHDRASLQPVQVQRVPVRDGIAYEVEQSVEFEFVVNALIDVGVVH